MAVRMTWTWAPGASSGATESGAGWRVLRAESLWARQPPSLGRLGGRRAPSVAGALGARVPLPEAAAASGPAGAFAASVAGAAGSPKVNAGFPPASRGRTVGLSGEPRHAAGRRFLLVAESAACLGRAGGVSLLLLVVLALLR